MKEVFADTFYWIALTDPGDASYARAHQFKADIATIDEVLGEYLTFFSGVSANVRRNSLENLPRTPRRVPTRLDTSLPPYTPSVGRIADVARRSACATVATLTGCEQESGM